MSNKGGRIGVKSLRSLLFSKWFFAALFFTSITDLASDIAERSGLQFWGWLNAISIGLSAVVALLAGWMFLDLHTRKPR